MKKITIIASSLLLTMSVFAQKPACDCADCKEQAAAAAAGQQFTLPGLQGLNQFPTNQVKGVGSGVSVIESSHEEHVHGEECSHDSSTEVVLHDHDGDGVPDHETHDDDHEGHDHGSSGEVALDDHAGHDHGDHEEQGIELPAEIIKKVGLKVLEAKGGTVALSSTFPTEIKLNRDRSASVSPRFPSIVRQVFAEIGDEVKKGDVLASLENRETMAVYTISAPQDGIIISKDLAVGETAGEDSVLYKVADLTTVWADISIFPEYQHLVRKNTPVTFVAHDGHTAKGTIKYVSPIVSHETRTFTARCVLKGADEDFAPGAFVRAQITVKQIEANVVVPREAIQRIEGEFVVFTPSEHGFVATPVQIGTEGEAGIEILSGLKPNDPYVAAGAFALKAQMVTSGMDPHAGHGH
jgi:cobalt-zinc-cadmium efflux system membrane fusion protein